MEPRGGAGGASSEAGTTAEGSDILRFAWVISDKYHPSCGNNGVSARCQQLFDTYSRFLVPRTGARRPKACGTQRADFRQIDATVVRWHPKQPLSHTTTILPSPQKRRKLLADQQCWLSRCTIANKMLDDSPTGAAAATPHINALEPLRSPWSRA
jgi:hypothetical protein